jgi:hypothetical protein
MRDEGGAGKGLDAWVGLPPVSLGTEFQKRS